MSEKSIQTQLDEIKEELSFLRTILETISIAITVNALGQSEKPKYLTY